MYKWPFFLSILSLSWFLNPARAGEYYLKPTGDTIYFVSGTFDYHVLLEDKPVLFEWGTIGPFDNYTCMFWVKNNTGKTITVDRISNHASGKISVELKEPQSGTDIKPGNTFCIFVKPNVLRSSNFQHTVPVTYNVEGEKKTLLIKMSGSVINTVEKNHRYLLNDSSLANPKERVFEEYYNKTRYPTHRVVEYIDSIQENSYSLTGEKQGFYIGEVISFPSAYRYRIVNNTGHPIVLKEVNGSTDQVMFYVQTSGKGWNYLHPKSALILPDSSFFVKGANYNGIAMLIDVSLNIRYEMEGKEYAVSIPTWGMINPSMLFKTERQNPMASVVNTKPKTVKEPEVLPTQPKTHTTRPEGLVLYDIGKLVSRNNDTCDYTFTLHSNPKKEDYGFSPRKEKDPVFSWDTITGSEVLSPIRFKLKNASDYAVTILSIRGTNNTVLYLATNQVLVYPDSMLTIEAVPNLLHKGHFYHSLIVSFQSAYGIKQFELKQWGYIPENGSVIASKKDSLELVKLQRNFYLDKEVLKNNPIRVYVTNGGKSNYPELSLKLFVKENQALIKSQKDPAGNDFFRVYRNGWDTLLVHVLSETGEVLEKMRFTNSFEHDIWCIPIFRVPNPYTYHYGRVPYKVQKGIYKPEQVKDIYGFIDTNYIKKYAVGNDIHFRKDGMIEMRDIDQAITLQEKLLDSQNPIRLLPVFESSINEEIRWYTNRFTVSFYEHVSEEQVKTIFSRYKITDYERESYNGENSWTFSLKQILDRKYLKVLDQLWQLKEVSGLIHENRYIPMDETDWH